MCLLLGLKIFTQCFMILKMLNDPGTFQTIIKQPFKTFAIEALLRKRLHHSSKYTNVAAFFKESYRPTVGSFVNKDSYTWFSYEERKIFRNWFFSQSTSGWHVLILFQIISCIKIAEKNTRGFYFYSAIVVS